MVTTIGTGDDWALRRALELCGAVPPPAYADVATAAHLSTFDVDAGGHAVLFGADGRLYALSLLWQAPRKATGGGNAAREAPTAAPLALAHVALDPPLPLAEIRELEQLQVNASGTHVLLVARTWVKVAKLPAPLAEVLAPGRASLQTPKRASGAALRLSSDRGVQRFRVQFADGAVEDVALDASTSSSLSTASDHERVHALLTQRRKAAAVPIASVSREVGTASVRQVGYFTSVLQAAWHPLSDAHVVVLSDAEEVTVFNTHQDVAKPEQRHLLDFPVKGRATGAASTAFAFGSPTMLWDVFTCYVLRSDGAVFALCPLVPFDCRVSSAVIATLRSEVDAHLTLCKHKIGALTGAGQSPSEHQALLAQLAELKSQKYWLHESWALDAPTRRRSVADEEAPTTIECFRCVKPHVSGISPDTWPLALQGAVDVAPKSVVEGKHNAPGGSSATSLLLVPCPPPRGDKMRASVNPFLVRSYTSGHVELLLLDAPIRPQWKSGTLGGARKLPALLLECLNLGVDDSGGKAVLERDPADPRLIYSFHSTGVHVINLSWVFALAAGKQFTALPKSSNVFFGHLLLLRLASGAFEVVNVSAASSELLKGVRGSADADESLALGGVLDKPFAKLPGALAPIAASKARQAAAGSGASATGVASAAIRSFGDVVEERVEALAARGTRVTGTTQLHEVDDAVLAFVIERVKILFEDVEYIDGMDTLMKDRLRLHAEMIKNQSEKAAAVQQSMAAAKQSLAKLQQKMERALAVQQNLRKRAAAVLQAVKENQPNLSRAEREFKIELEQMAVEVRRMKPRVAQATVSSQRMVRSLENVALSASVSSSSSRFHASSAAGASGALSEEKKRMCYDVLRAETQLIDNTKALIEDMTASLQRLKT
ncbi:hypothetical protein PybrP1_009546 [[Pythium] brassicae (nom. inval.)]|nr:hypothetical protein PybrP1_009546 [[Pythium] brassicae (nom. inval.)]